MVLETGNGEIRGHQGNTVSPDSTRVRGTESSRGTRDRLEAWRAPAVPASSPCPSLRAPQCSFSLTPPDHEAEDRQESLRQRFSGSREEQVRAGTSRQPPRRAPARHGVQPGLAPTGESWTGSWRHTRGGRPSPWTSRLSALTARVSPICYLLPRRCPRSRHRERRSPPERVEGA